MQRPKRSKLKKYWRNRYLPDRPPKVFLSMGSMKRPYRLLDPEFGRKVRESRWSVQNNTVPRPRSVLICLTSLAG